MKKIALNSIICGLVVICIAFVAWCYMEYKVDRTLVTYNGRTYRSNIFLEIDLHVSNVLGPSLGSIKEFKGLIAHEIHGLSSEKWLYLDGADSGSWYHGGLYHFVEEEQVTTLSTFDPDEYEIYVSSMTESKLLFETKNRSNVKALVFGIEEGERISVTDLESKTISARYDCYFHSKIYPNLVLKYTLNITEDGNVFAILMNAHGNLVEMIELKDSVVVLLANILTLKRRNYRVERKEIPRSFYRNGYDGCDGFSIKRRTKQKTKSPSSSIGSYRSIL